MWTVPPTDGAGADTPGRDGARNGGGGSGEVEGDRYRSRRRRARDGIVWAARLPGAWLIATGTSLLAGVAGIDDIAEALDHVGFVSVDHVSGAGVSFIGAGLATLSKMMLAGKDLLKVKKAVDENTATVNAMKDDMSTMKTDISDIKGDMSTMKTDISDIKGDISDIKDGIATLNTTTERMATSVDRMATAIGDLTDELRRGNGRAAGS